MNSDLLRNLRRILNARVYSMAIEMLLERAPKLSS
jgi:hypothetical protein